jgi:uncharacterized protein YuzE
MKLEAPEGHDKYNEYDFDNRISYDEETDTMYIYVAPPQGQVGAVMVYTDKKGDMVAIDTDEVNTQVGVEIIGVSRLMKKYAIKNTVKNN